MKLVAGAPKGETLVTFMFEGAFDGLETEARSNNFCGKEREVLVAYPAKGKPAKRVIAAGLGKREQFTTEKLRRAAAAAAIRVRALELAEVSLLPPAPGSGSENAHAAIEGFLLQLYEYKRWKSKNSKPLKLKSVRVQAGEDVVLLQARPETVWSKKSRAVGAKTDALASIVDTLVNPFHAGKGRQPV